jgi:protein-disulfide isomerase
MTDASKKNRMPLLASMAAIALLGGLGSYLYFRQSSADKGDAATAATAAISAAGMSDAEKKATEAIVRAYILENPEIITEAVQILQQRETTGRLAAAGDSITQPFASAEGGNPKGDVTIVEFTDYSCGYCRASVGHIKQLTGADQNVRIVYREVPILSPASVEAARWALAAAKQGKHQAFHDAMFSGEKPNEASIKLAATKAGLDMAKAAQDAQSEAVTAEIKANQAYMQKIGFGGTPTFIVGDQLLEGAVGYEALKAAVIKARKKA